MSVFLTAEWRKLVFFNYQISPTVLAPYVPKGTELDTFQGKHYISLVGFLFKDVKLKGVKVPFHHTFEEINLRFYVKRAMPDGTWRRGTVFIKEVVPKAAISFVANTIYGEHYQTRNMRYVWDKEKISYALKDGGKWHEMVVNYNPDLKDMEGGSMDEFITEHYFGYTLVNDKITNEYEVTHPRWQKYNVNNYAHTFDFEKLYGKPFSILSQQKPDTVILAEGSAISVLGRTRLTLS